MTAYFKSILSGTRLGAAIGVLALLTALTYPPVVYGQSIKVAVTQIPLQPGEGADGLPVERVGSLLYRGGLKLVSADNRFGGLSALHVSADGKKLIALSDDGVRLDARLTYTRNGWLRGLRRTALKPLNDLSGVPLAKKIVRDAETLALVPTGGLIVGFEHTHRIWRYPRTGTPRNITPPPSLSEAPRNQGLEAMTRLHDGRLLLITEGFDAGDQLVRCWLGNAPRWQPVKYRPHRGYKPTAAATLPNGDIILVERWASRLAGISIRVKRLKQAGIQSGATLITEELALIERPMNVDNFEGISARRDKSGRTLIYIVSDDNFSILQRTLLLMFELEG